MNEMTLARGSGVALWRQIQQSIQRDITEDVFKPGDRLPTEFELAAQFGVNRHTVRRALAELEDKGLLRVEQGRGTFVREHVIDYQVGRRTRFTENLTRQNRAPRAVLVGASTIPVEKEVAAALGIVPRLAVLKMETAGEAEGRRISFSCHYLPLPRFDGIATAFEKAGSLTVAFQAYGINDYVRRTTRIISRMPSGREAEYLDQPRKRPVLVTESVNADEQGMAVEFVATCFNSDWVQLVLES